MITRVSIEEFLKLESSIPVIDVRSPSEYGHAHIPGSFNIPLFSDDERAVVGTLYHKKNSVEATLAGLEFAGKKLRKIAEEALNLQEKGKLLVHCWRGGMRSEAVAWLLEKTGIECHILEGGYKSYRNYALAYFSKPFHFMVLGGLTGSGKTEVLGELKKRNMQVIDLEATAGHKGSAFGSLGELPQASNEQFENNLFSELYNLDLTKEIWIEDESRNIGHNVIPGKVFSTMSENPLIYLDLPLEIRIRNLVEKYAGYPSEELALCIRKISRRIGGTMTRDAIDALNDGNPRVAAGIILDYYDKTYTHSILARVNKEIVYVRSATMSPGENADKVLSAVVK